MNNDYLSAPFSDTTVDNLQDTATGVIDTVSSLSFDIDDKILIKNLENRLNDSQTYWNKPDGFNLKQVRNDNIRLYLGKHLDQNKLYRYQTPYVENQIYIGEEAIVSYLTAQRPAPEVYPAQDSERSRIFAQNLEKAMKAHSDLFQLPEILGNVVRNALNKRVGFIELSYDPLYGRNGEIIPEAVNPEHVVVDKNAKQGQNPGFITKMLKMTANEVLSRWPEKKEIIFKELGIVRGTMKQMEEVVHVRKVLFTYYDKSYKPQEGVAYYFGDTMLEKVKNPDYIYSDREKNFLPTPMKMIIPLNFDNDGEHWIDYTGPIEQAATMQDVLNKRGRQLMEVVDKANGLTVFSADSGLSKDDVQNITGDPNQRIIIKTNSRPVSELVHRIDAPAVPTILMQDKIDLRTQLHSILGTPSEFTGANDGGETDPTLGQSIMKKNQASGRQDLFVRAIDRFLTRYFNALAQMMVTWYDEDHFFVYNGDDGDFDYITISRGVIENGMIVSVKSGATLPFDKSRQENVALGLAKMGLLSPLDIYKLLSLPNSQQLYDNWAKYKTAPIELARDALDELDTDKAYVAYTKIMNGKDADQPEEVTKEFVLSLRKLMITDDFIKADTKYQNAFIKYVETSLAMLEAKMSLDKAADSDNIQGLDPMIPLAQLQQQGMMPPANPGIAPQQGGVSSPPGASPVPPSPFGGASTPLGGSPTPPIGFDNPNALGAPQPILANVAPQTPAPFPPV